MRPHRPCSRLRQLAQLVACGLGLAGAATPAALGQPVFELVNRAAGLPSDYVNEIYQDQFGFMWFGTDAGLARYDGYRVETFTSDDGLPHPFVYAVREDEQGVLWVGTFEGLAWFDGSRFRWADDPFSGQQIVDLAVDERGRLIAVAEGGLARREGETWRVVRSGALPGALTGVVPLSGDRLLGVGWGTPVVLEPSVDTFLVRELVGDLHPARAFRVAREPSGTVLLYHQDATLRRIRIEGVHVEVLDSGTVANVTELVPDADGGVAVAIGSGAEQGVYRLDAALRRGDAPMHSARSQSLMFDYEGNLWIGTFGSGALRLGGEHLKTLVGAPATRIERGPEGSIWATGDGLWQIDPHTLQSRQFYPSMALREILFGTAGEFWVSSGPTLYRGTGRVGSTLRRFQSDPGWVSGVDVVGDTVRMGSYSEGIRTAISGVDAGTLREGRGLPTDMIEGLVRQSGVLWAKTRSHGAFRISGATAIPLGREQGLPSSAVFSVYGASDGSTWFGTDNGIAQLVEGQGRLSAMGQEILKGQRVNGFFERDGYVWAVGERMLFVVSEGEVLPVGGFTILPDEEASINDMIHDAATDRLFLVTTRGVVSVDLEALPSGLRPRPRVAIRSVQFGETQAQVQGSVLAATTKPAGPGRQRVEIEIAALSYAGPVYAEVRLNDGEWTNIGTERRVVYPELAAGTYSFEVRAISEIGETSVEVATLAFSIQPWWWQHPLALMVYGVWALGALVLAIRYVSQRRLREQVRALELKRRLYDERERISRDLHDHVGAQLSSLLAGVELARLEQRASGDGAPPARGGAGRDAGDALDGIEADARTTMRQLRETIWALHGASVSLEELAGRVRRDLAARAAGVRSTVTCAEGADATLSPVQALNLYRIVQEAITNALKHAGARQLEVALGHDGQRVRVDVRDDGTFRPPGGDGASGLTGFGMRSMQARAERLGGELAIDTSAGTRVRVTVPAEPTDAL